MASFSQIPYIKGTGLIECINSIGDFVRNASSSTFSMDGKNGAVGRIRPYF